MHKSVSAAAWRRPGAGWALTSQRNTHFPALLFPCGLHLFLSSFPSSESRVACDALREECKWPLGKDPVFGFGESCHGSVALQQERGFKRWLVTSHDCFLPACVLILIIALHALTMIVSAHLM